MHADRYKTDDGHYVDEDEVWWDTPESFIQGRMLNFCCCGSEENNLEYVRDGLQHINDHGPDNHTAWLAWRCDVHIPERLGIFGNEKSAQFFFYWADSMGLTEHGSSIPGWLTKAGHDLLDDLNELLEMGGNTHE